MSGGDQSGGLVISWEEFIKHNVIAIGNYDGFS
jgi:hypothetical protein